MVGMTLVDHCACLLEASPDFLTQFLSHRTNLAELVVEFLQLVEGAYHILLVGQFLSSLAEGCLSLEVLLEVVLTSLEIHLEQVIELFEGEFVVIPQFSGILSRHGLDFLPLLLHSLHILIMVACLLWTGGKGFYLFNDFLLTLKVLLFLSLQFLSLSLFAFLDERHLGFEHFFSGVRECYILHWVATTLDESLLCCITLLTEQIIVSSLEVVGLCLSDFFLAVGKFLNAVEHFFLSSVKAFFERHVLRVHHCFFSLMNR